MVYEIHHGRPMTPCDIKILLLQRGTTQQSIADSIGVDAATVSQVIHRRRRTPFVRRAIAAELRISYRSCWGEDDPGIDRLPAGRPKSTNTLAHSGATQGR